jgi:hypothetical protein
MSRRGAGRMAATIAVVTLMTGTMTDTETIDGGPKDVMMMSRSLQDTREMVSMAVRVSSRNTFRHQNVFLAALPEHLSPRWLPKRTSRRPKRNA